MSFCISFDALALEIGDSAPDISGLDQSNKLLSFKDFYQNGYLLVFFYPRAHTPGCTAQNESLRDQYQILKQKKISMVGVSTDSVKKQFEFHQELRLPFNLVSDEKEQIAKAFGVSVNFGFASRQAFLIKAGKIVWVDHDASTKDQAQDILKAVADIETTTSQKK
jgi:peroxiredoxin Q/BCP